MLPRTRGLASLVLVRCWLLTPSVRQSGSWLSPQACMQSWAGRAEQSRAGLSLPFNRSRAGAGPAGQRHGGCSLMRVPRRAGTGPPHRRRGPAPRVATSDPHQLTIRPFTKQSAVPFEPRRAQRSVGRYCHRHRGSRVGAAVQRTNLLAVSVTRPASVC